MFLTVVVVFSCYVLKKSEGAQKTPRHASYLLINIAGLEIVLRGILDTVYHTSVSRKCVLFPSREPRTRVSLEAFQPIQYHAENSLASTMLHQGGRGGRPGRCCTRGSCVKGDRSQGRGSPEQEECQQPLVRHLCAPQQVKLANDRGRDANLAAAGPHNPGFLVALVRMDRAHSRGNPAK